MTRSTTPFGHLFYLFKGQECLTCRITHLPGSHLLYVLTEHTVDDLLFRVVSSPGSSQSCPFRRSKLSRQSLQ